MNAFFNINNIQYTVDLSNPLDISIVLQASEKNLEAWYLEPPKIDPVVIDDWVAKVSEGASINFNNIFFNPHAHGTHTECVGHISEEFHSVNKALKEFFFLAEVITVAPETLNNDQVISAKQLKKLLADKKPEAIVIRTLPNTSSKNLENILIPTGLI